MRVLPPRTYAPDARIRKKLLPHGIQHPAKMHLELARDLFLRYTREGQTVVDPFFGVGGSLVGITLGRNVIGQELEPPFVEYSEKNFEHLRGQLPGMTLGWALILQGDSRRLKLPDADDVDAAVGSPPFGEMNAAHAGGHVVQRPGPRGNGWDGGREDFVYSEETPGQIGNLVYGHARVDDACVASPPYLTENQGGAKITRDQRLGAAQASLTDEAPYGTTPGQIYALKAGDVDAAIGSPPYGDVASRDRSQEGYAQGMHPELRDKYGAGDTNRHVDGYGESPGQIGHLRHGCSDAAAVGSPPFADSLATSGEAKREWKRADGSPQGIGGSQFTDYGQSEGQIGAEDGETYADAVLQVYRDCFRVVRPGGLLVLVTGNYVRDGQVVDLAADTIKLATAAGWTPVERWEHRKGQVSFWRRLHHRQGRPVVTSEDVLVFCKGPAPAWEFAELAPTTRAPAELAVLHEGAAMLGVALPLPLDGLDRSA